MRFTGRIHQPIAASVRALKEVAAALELIPLFTTERGRHILRLVRGPLPRPGTGRIWINILLFVATLFTTLMTGAFFAGVNPLAHFWEIWRGIPFSFSLLLILGGHELGHYFTARANGVAATLPYFLPVPYPLIGTAGAFIQMKSLVPDRNALVRVGVAGPLIGFAIALPVTLVGLALSHIRPVTELAGGIGLGSSLLFQGAAWLFHGTPPPGSDIVLHPMAYAGWLGLFVTALNLVPIGQLDGGHVGYALWGRRRWITIGVGAVLAALGMLWLGWLVWVALALLLGLRHPAVQDEVTPLGRREKVLALIALVVLALTFVPRPFMTLGH